MMQCPVCKTTYTDTTLRYCLADGATLTDLSDEQPTIVSTHADETIDMRQGSPVRVDIRGEPPPVHRPAPSSRGSSSGILKVLVVIVAVGILAVLAAAAGIFIYLNRNGPETVSIADNKNTRTAPSPVPSPRVSETDELRDQIANLEKLLNEQKKNSQPANIPLSMPKQSSTTTPARVNSPGDGFLALRTLPNSEFGERILKIPHGATVSVGGCGPVVKPVNRSGRWCQASYNGYSGWVFDGYLIY